MSTIAALSGQHFDQMVSRGAFVDLEPLRIELIYGDLRFTNPAGLVYEGEVQFLMEWSMANTNQNEISVRVQSSINCGDHRPEPHLVWVRKMPSRRLRSTHDDVLLLIEVTDSSTVQDLGEKARLYAEHTIPEYWVVDVPAEQVHVHHTPLGGRYESIQSFGKSDRISPRCHIVATLALSELFDLDS